MGSSQETYRLSFPDHKPTPPYTHVSYGLPFTEAVAKHVTETFRGKRAYILASPSITKQTSNTADLEKALGPRHAGTWLGIPPHTPWDALVPIINDMREKKADCLVTLGAGSLSDGAKAIKYALANNVATIEDMEALVAPTEKDLEMGGEALDRSTMGNEPEIPVIMVPTSLSAGEYSRFAGITSPKTKAKAQLFHPKMYASLIVLDPALTTTTPEWVWLSTGVRAIDHCCECYCSPHGNAEVDAAAEKSLKKLLTNLPITKRDPQNLDARLQCQLAANYIMNNLLWAPEVLMAGASHGIGHQLGPLGVGHGQTSCILLPAVMRYNKKVNEEKQEKLKNVIWQEPAVAEMLTDSGLKQDESDLADALDKAFRILGMPRSLKEVGVGRDQFDMLAQNSLRDVCCIVNPIPFTDKEQVLEILEKCL
ncbi:putative Fe-containing alcohol dehydrogenase [Rhizodiscina lignyota]|uniref:Fe-containing alcohol dehydrogenase n=1 Tax=Rhizodiscina lignyota TaxID=1504668 RepID=A0A9P4M7U6_9PEZI|nr:putative Fe-containing alcohol dehydrogenase [Rhizodiscina lignyota]